MNAEQLIERLEGMGVLDEKILDKLRREIKNPDKEVKPEQILKYLVKKQEITQNQAKSLLKQIESPKPVQHEEIVVVQPVEYDTGDLTADVAEDLAGKAVKPVEEFVEEAPANVEATTADIVEVMPEPAPAFGNLGDPLGDPLGNEDFSQGTNQETAIQSGTQDVLATKFVGKNYRPDQWQTKWLYIGFGILGSLLLFGAVLYIAVGRQSAEDLYTAITTSFDAGTYGDAISKSDEFLEKFPKDENAPKVKSLRVNALVAQTYESKNWDETIKRCETLVPPLIEDETVNMESLRQDLGVILPTTTLRITERALQQETPADMQRELDFSKRAQEVATKASFVPTSTQKLYAAQYQQIKDNILMVEGRIAKEERYIETRDQIIQLSAEGKTDDAFASFRALTREYGDLGAREELQTLMLGVSQRESDLVKTTSVELNKSDSERPSPIETTYLLASKNGDAIPALLGEITPIFAEGTLYGIDVGDGSVKWRRFLGYETTIQPQKLGQDFLVVADERTNDLICIGRKDNQVKWRVEIAEPFVAPSINETMVVVTTKSGKVIKLNPADGMVQASCQLPQGATVSALISEHDPYIYQPGNYSNLYVLSTEDLSCREVFYLGHRLGSVQVPPVNWSGHILIGVNGGSSCDLYVLRGLENGINLDLIQLFPQLTDGPVTNNIQRIGRWMLVASESGDMKVLSINPVNEETPVSKAVEEKFERRGTVQTQILTSGSNLFLAGQGIIKFKLQASQNIFKKPLILNHADSFISPMAIFDDALIHTRRRAGSRMVSISAVDMNTMAQIWRTDLGAPVAGSPKVEGDEISAFSNQGDLFSFGPTPKELVKSSTVIETLQFNNRMKLSDDAEVVVGPINHKDILYVETKNNSTKLVRLQEPADRPASAPIVLQGDLIVPSLVGPVARINPKTGDMIGTPFQPPIQPGTQQKWVRPAIVGDGMFVIANEATDQSNSVFYVLDGRSKSSLVSLAQIDSAPVRSQIVSIGPIAYAVVIGDQGEQLVALDSSTNLEQKAAAQIGGALVDGPWLVDGMILVANDADQMVCFDGQLNQKWTYPLPNIRLSGDPVVLNNSIVLPFEDGRMDIINPQDGKSVSTVELNQPIVGSPTVAGQEVYIGGMDGTVHVLNMNQN